jgi:acetyl/propionyl-CoA carboxylase alpha subunit
MDKKLNDTKLKVLVANRGEIACRVFQACRELGLGSVGIFVKGDEEARHITYADEVIEVPGYLDSDAILNAALQLGVKMIHPGYGFLSERAHFARKVIQAGLVFVGPRPETMEALGEKIPSKKLADAQKIPTAPWANIKLGDDAALKKEASLIGYPLLLKASGGGGGKGMRLIEREEDLLSSAESASREAMASFGDGAVFLEKLIRPARHIEVQVFGDGLGGGVHLFERECSLQRRHQKVWEESPAVGLSEQTRKGLHESALKLACAVKYRSAGTVEFLVDPKGDFYFLEMNTRLQVEHPVTEEVTGVDLVCAQLGLALNEILDSGKPSLEWAKNLSQPRGHSIEVRIYAEDPSQGFMPTHGRIEKLKWPTGTGIRVESGIEEGQTIGTQFDPMLAKLIVTAPGRAQAISRMRFALSELLIHGIGTNQAFLLKLAEHPAVQQARVHTQWIESELKTSLKLSAPDVGDWPLIEAAKGLESAVASRSSNLSTGTESPFTKYYESLRRS